MVALRELVDYTDALLQSAAFSDYCPNGLQVEGRSQVGSIVTGVTASLALLEAAAAAGADAVLVHHGYFWKGEDACVTGMKRARLKQLLSTDTSLLAWHLPLDAHAELGNNAQLARVLDLQQTGSFGQDGGLQLAREGELAHAMTPSALCAHIEQCLGRAPYVKFMKIEELEREVTAAGFKIIETGNHPPPSRYIVAKKTAQH